MAIRHGTTDGYTNHHCKCAACRSAWAAAYRIYRAKRRAKGLCVECSTQSQRSRCPHHLLLNAMRQAVRIAARKKEEAMSQATAILILLILAALAVTACGDVRENMTGPSAITGAPTPGQLRQAPVEILDRLQRGR